MVEFLRARNVFGRRRAEELVRNVELKEMKEIVKIEGEAVIVNDEWLSKVCGGNKRVLHAIERECEQLLAMRREGDHLIGSLMMKWSDDLTIDK